MGLLKIPQHKKSTLASVFCGIASYVSNPGIRVFLFRDCKNYKNGGARLCNVDGLVSDCVDCFLSDEVPVIVVIIFTMLMYVHLCRGF